MKSSIIRFAFYLCLSAVICGCFSSVGYASPQPSAENNVHFCLPLNLEDMQARDSIYAATKHALNLNVGEPRTVRMIYFLPNDRPFRQEVVDSMKVAIRQIQTFYVEQMQAHGYGNKTFRFETDAQDEPLVHRMDGQHSDSHYLDNTSLTVLDEVEQVFDVRKNIYFIVVDNSIDAIGTGNGKQAGGVGVRREKNGGYGVVPGGFSFHTAAHELGHAFGLAHDFRDGNYIMSYGFQRHSLSACSALFLVSNPYFNANISLEKGVQTPTRQLLSPRFYPAGTGRVSIQLKVRASDGLHQVILFVETREPHSAAGFLEVKACRGFAGEREAIVEFDYDGVIPSAVFSSLSEPPVHPIFIMAVDTEGNVSAWEAEAFSLRELSPHHIATLEGHTRSVRSVAFSSDGAMLASGSWDSTIKMWDIARKENIATLEEHTRPINSVVFSPDGTMLASGASDSTIKLWDVAARTNIATFEGHKSSVWSVAFSPNGTSLGSGSSDRTVKLWDIATGQNIATYRHIDEHSDFGRTQPVWSVAFSPDRTTLASGGGSGTVILWDMSEWIRPRPQTLVKISGDNQQGTPGMELTNPFVVEVKDQHDNPLSDVQVTFKVTKGDGKLSQRFTVENTMTDANGRAQSIITLGPNLGTNTVGVTIPGFEPVTFNAVGVGMPATPIMGGDYRKWHLPDGAIIRLGKGHLGESDRAVAFSPDGQSLAVAGGIGVWLYDVVTLRELALFTGHTRWVTSVAFSPEGTMLASGSSDKTVKLWDIATGRTIATLEGHTGWVTSVVFSLDGTTLASVSGQRVKLWDLVTKQHIATLVHTHSVNSVVFSSDDTMLASGSWGGNSSTDAGIVWLWDVSTRHPIATLEGHTGAVTSVDFSSNVSTLASGSFDGTIKLWNTAMQTNIATLKGHTNRVNSVAFSSDGTTLASGSFDGTIKLWNTAMQTNITTLEGHKGHDNSVAFSPDGTTLISGGEDGVKLWDVLTQSVSNIEGHSRNVFFSRFSPDGTMLAAGIDRMVKIWDVNTGHPVVTFEGHTEKISSVAFFLDGITIASASSDNTIRLWDISTGRTIATFEVHIEQVSSVVFSPDGTIFASWGGRGNAIELWDVATGRDIATLKGHTSWISSVVFSPDEMLLASGSDDNTVKLWDISTGRNIVTLEGHRGQVLSVAFSPDGTILASIGYNGYGQEIKLWDVATGRTITTLKGHTSWISSMGFSPDGTMLASGGDSGIVELWEIPTGRPVATMEGHTDAIHSGAFSPDGTSLASGGYFNDEVKLWDVMTGRTIATLEHSGVYSIMFSPGGVLLASRSNDGTVLLWDMSLYITPQTPNPDFNSDGRVDLSDFLLFASQFGLSRGDEQYDAKYDLDGDGTIGFGDFLIFGGSFGKEGS